MKRSRRYILALLLGTAVTAGAATWYGGPLAISMVSTIHHPVAGGGDPICPPNLSGTLS